MKAETIADLVLLVTVILIAGAGFLAGWRSAKASEARKRYREEHPRYQHSGAIRD